MFTIGFCGTVLCRTTDRTSVGEYQHTIEDVEVTELTGQGSVCWQVITVQSEHRFDLDAGTVKRRAGQEALILRPSPSQWACLLGGNGADPCRKIDENDVPVMVGTAQ